MVSAYGEVAAGWLVASAHGDAPGAQPAAAARRVRPLRDRSRAAGGRRARGRDLGRVPDRRVRSAVGTTEMFHLGLLANEHEPELRTHDRFGNRVDEVEFHPAWHRLLETSVAYGLHSLPFERPAGEGARVGTRRDVLDDEPG